MPASASLIPINAVVANVSSGNVAAAVATATIPATAGRLNYITGFSVSGSGATTGLPVQITVTGLIGSTLTYIYTAANGVLASNLALIVDFPTPLPASALNTAIVVSCPSLGSGNTNNSVNVHGYTE